MNGVAERRAVRGPAINRERAIEVDGPAENRHGEEFLLRHVEEVAGEDRADDRRIEVVQMVAGND